MPANTIKLVYLIKKNTTKLVPEIHHHQHHQPQKTHAFIYVKMLAKENQRLKNQNVFRELMMIQNFQSRYKATLSTARL